MSARGCAIALALIALVGSGCATSPDGTRYRTQTPDFDLFEFFEGEVVAWGIVQDRSGDVIQRFQATIRGEVDGDELVLDERFDYALGSGVTERTWTIERVGREVYRGAASDIEGPARGTAYGNALNWRYEMSLPVGKKTYRVTFDDWIWALDADTIINRSYLSKFGLNVAEVTLFMRRVHPRSES